MSNRFKYIYILILSIVTPVSMAVQVNPKGLGEVLIYPYYSVNNSLNTAYSVVNTTGDTKALTVRFLEGDNGIEVLTFNVYLSAYDVWTGFLVSGISTQNGHVGEPSAVHLSTDTSCAPFLNKAGQEVLPFVLDTDIDSDNHSLKRATEGYIEIIETSTFNGSTVAAADHGFDGIPSDCAAIQADWSDNGLYDLNADEQATTGGILGSVTLVNVAEGIAFPYDAIALQNFWQGAGLHTEPGSLLPNLNSAFPQSTVLLDNGELANSAWEHGFQAVSAVLTKAQVINEYALETILDSKTEWVMSFPTKRFHTNNDIELLAPFTELWDGSLSCDVIVKSLWDRSSAEISDPPCGDPCGPGQYSPRFCKTSNVLEFSLLNALLDDGSKLLGSDNRWVVSALFNEAELSGWGHLDLSDKQGVTPVSGSRFKGLPVTGFSVVQYTNAGAAAGLLAQYGSVFLHKGQYEVDTD